MSRPLRIEYPGAIFHITTRGNEKRDIYRDDADRNCFLELLEEAVRRFGWIVTAYVLMSNHFHLLLELTSKTLSRGMHWLNGEYARRFNRRHGRVGHLVQGRFDHRLVEAETYLLEVLRYVVLNPVRAGMVAEPGQYRWSSYAATAGDAPAPPWLAVDKVLALFGRDCDMARRRYRRFVEDGISSRRVPWDDLIGQIYLGSEPWIASVRERVQSEIRPDEHPQVQREVGGTTMANVITSVARALRIDEARLRSGRGGVARMLAAWIGYYEGHMTLRPIAAGLRLRSASHVSKLIRRCDAQLADDPMLRKSLEACTERLYERWKSVQPQA